MFLYPIIFENLSLDERMTMMSDIQSDAYILLTAKSKLIKDIILIKTNELEPFLNSVRNFKGVEALYVGMIRIIESSKCSTVNGDKVYEVVNSAATKGFGPLMYELAMSSLGQTWIMPDRASVSSDAAGVWNRFYDREDVAKKQLKNCKQFKNPSLNFAYTLLSPRDVSGIETRSNQLLEKVAKEAGFSVENVKQVILEYSQAFFDMKFSM